jgi:thioredoxin:protein disulfide reductase
VFSMSLRPGAWMEWIKSLFGIMFFLAALYYLKNVFPPLAHFASARPAFALAMAAMVAVGVALGAVNASFHGSIVQRVRKTAAVSLVIVGLFGAINYALTPKIDPEHALVWLSDEKAALADARAAGRPLIVDFAADWCVPCKEFDVRVFSRPEVAREMRRFTLLRVDLSKGDDDPEIAAIKKKYAADTLPAVRIVSRDGAIVARTDELLPADRFLSLLTAAH